MKLPILTLSAYACMAGAPPLLQRGGTPLPPTTAAAFDAVTTINLQIDNEFHDPCGSGHWGTDMKLTANDTFIGTVTGKGAFNTTGGILPHGGNRAYFVITPDSSGTADVMLHWNALVCQSGQETIEITANPVNVSLSKSWDAKYGCMMRGPAASPTFLITVCESGDKRDFCVGDGTCPH